MVAASDAPEAAKSRTTEPFAMHQMAAVESVARYLQQLDTADRQEPSEALLTKAQKPHHLNIVPSLTLKPSARLNPVEIA